MRRRFGAQDLYRQIFKVWRKKRFELFLHTLHPDPSDRLLDVGGFPGFWTAQPQPVQCIDSLNLEQVVWTGDAAPHHNIRTLVGDGCALHMPDAAYDIGFSNSVIEHVGSWDRQRQFAAEIRRVAKALWVQTPAYECPFEPHYMAPFIHYVPPQWQKRLIPWCTPWGWLEHPSPDLVGRTVDSTRLLRKSEMTELFPDCQILTERILGLLPKSYIAVRRRD